MPAINFSPLVTKVTKNLEGNEEVSQLNLTNNRKNTRGIVKALPRNNLYRNNNWTMKRNNLYKAQRTKERAYRQAKALHLSGKHYNAENIERSYLNQDNLNTFRNKAKTMENAHSQGIKNHVTALNAYNRQQNWNMIPHAFVIQQI